MRKKIVVIFCLAALGTPRLFAAPPCHLEKLGSTPASSRLNDIPPQFAEELRAIFAEHRLHFGGVRPFPGKHPTGNENQIEGLLKLGCYWEQRGKHKHLFFPDDPLAIFENFISAVDAEVKAKTLKPDQTFFPAFAFQKRDGSYSEDKIVAVGVEEWPDPKIWKLVTNGYQYTHKDFYRFIADKKFIVTDLEHDFSHLSEKVLTPKLMALTSDYAKTIPPAQPDEIYQSTHSLWPTNPISSARARSLVLEEWLFVPDLKNKRQEIGSFIKTFKSPDSKSLQETTERFLKAEPEKLLEAYGGGARQGIQSAFVTSVDLRLKFGSAIRSKAPVGKEFLKDRTEDEYAVGESLYGILNELRFLYALRYQPESLQNEFPVIQDPETKRKTETKFADDIEGAPSNALLESYLTDRMQRFVAGLSTYAKHDLSAAQIYEASRLAPAEKGSPVQEFFHSFTHPNSFYRYAF